MMRYICPQGLSSRNHRTKSPSRMLPDLLERKGHAPGCQTFPPASFLIWSLPREPPEPGPQRGEALCPPTLLFPFPRPVSSLIVGSLLCPLEGDVLARITVVHLPWTASPPARLTSSSPLGAEERKVPVPGSWHFPRGFPRLTSGPFHTPLGSKPGA